MKTKQFNYEEAKQHPELVVYRNGEKPLQVLFADKKQSAYRIITITECGDDISHLTDGAYSKLHEIHDRDLLLIDTAPEPEPEPKQPIRKPFNYEAACRDMKVVNSDGEVLEIDFIKRYENNVELNSIKIVFSDGASAWYSTNGMNVNSTELNDYDIYLYEPPQAEEPEMWVNLYNVGKAYAGAVYSSKEKCIDGVLDGCIGQYKLIKG